MTPVELEVAWVDGFRVGDGGEREDAAGIAEGLFEGGEVDPEVCWY